VEIAQIERAGLMIDHVSITVRDLAASSRFYEQTLAPLGYARLRNDPTTVGFGKKYPELWLNHRPNANIDADTGAHVCLRGRDRDSVDRFHAAALAAGGKSDGAPGLRSHYHETYYAALVRDPDGNRIEAVTFLQAGN
jgi:catechol 2,3-dioxygenase-like lactoylglutathione lyase family enzyme